MNKKEIDNNLITGLQTDVVMAMLEQGAVKEAENKLEEFGASKKEIDELLGMAKKINWKEYLSLMSKNPEAYKEFKEKK